MFGRLKYLALVLALMFEARQAAAQQKVFPIQATIQLQPPYSLFLADYAAEDERLKIHLFLRDLAKSNYPVRLRLKIEGFGITVVSKNSFYAPPIFLQGGQASLVAGADLQPYLNPQNLVFQGIDLKAFNVNGGKLPEGVYRISVEVQDYYRRETVSNEASTVVSVFLSYPPIVNLPVANAKVSAAFPQNLIFQWTPRHTASLNAAFQVAYKLRLVEVIPSSRDPNEAMRSSRPIFEAVTEQTQFIYGSGEPQLTPGSTYAFQVQAVEYEGKDMFVNQGYSEVVPFVYGEKCSVPANIVARIEDQSSLKVVWTALQMQQQFTIRYRESGRKDATWFEQDVFAAEYVIRGLKPGRTYEYQLGADCGFGTGEFTGIRKFEMPNAAFTSGDFVCGEDEPKGKINPDNLLTAFSPYTVFYAAGFPILVTEISSHGGKFTGRGEIALPFLKQLRFEVEFQNVQINNDYQLVAGTVRLSKQTLAQSVEESVAALRVTPNPDGTVRAVDSKGLPTIIDITLAEPGPVYDAATNTVTVTGLTPAGDRKEVKVLLQDGQPPFVFQDNQGATFEVDDQGRIHSRGKIPHSEIFAGGGLSSGALKTTKVEVKFLPDRDQHYGFDQFSEELSGNDLYSRHYQSVMEGERKTFISWKSLESGKGDLVLARAEVKDKAVDLSRIRFLNSAGDTLNSVFDGQSFRINLWGAPEGNDKEVNAFYGAGKDKKTGMYVGKLNLASLQKLNKQVVIVPVNGWGAGLTKAAVQDYLNEVYRQAIVEWEVVVDPVTLGPGWDANADGQLEGGSSSSMSAYTKEQKALASLYRQQHLLKENTYYIFLVDRFSDPEQKGYMVRNGQVGFVADDGDVLRNIAHELGHGAFALQHTWEALGDQTRGTTPNLMDYGGGTELWYYQWKYMRNPDIIFRPFEGDDEGAFLGTELYISPSGYPVKVPNEEIQAFIKDPLIQYNLLGKEYPNGALYGYRNKKGQVVLAKIKDGKFLGYENQTTKTIYSDNTAYTGKVKAFVIDEVGDGCTYKLYTVFYPVPNKASQVLASLRLNERTKDSVRVRSWCNDTPSTPLAQYEQRGRKNIALFVNGYRFGLPENPDSDNTVTRDDRFQYWEGIDKMFVDRLKSGTVLYADGHHSISTSNHRDIAHFYCSAKNTISSTSTDPKEIMIKYSQQTTMIIPASGRLFSYAIDVPAEASCFSYVGGKLNDEPNVEGFNLRRQSGRKAAEKLLADIKSRRVVLRMDSIDNVLDTLDIVAHSMGYAYALGMTDVLKGKIPFGRFYIVAPENAGSGEVVEADFQEVWQYGSDLNRKDGLPAEPLDMQDGVAPQNTVKGLDEFKRIFIPRDERKGFLKSHSIGNYHWIFSLTGNGKVAARIQ